MKRTLPVAVAASLVVLSVLSAVPAGAATTADAPWSGYQVAKNGTASGGWLGARKAAGQVVYRIDPSRTKTVTSGFRTASWQGTLPGTGPRRVTATDTSRAAWIVGKYGSYRYAVQNAAVEVALDELLHGGSWSLAGTTTRQRLTQSGHGSAIRSFATTMLRDPPGSPARTPSSSPRRRPRRAVRRSSPSPSSPARVAPGSPTCRCP